MEVNITGNSIPRFSTSLLRKNIMHKNTEYQKIVYLFVSSNHSPSHDQIDFSVCTGGEVFESFGRHVLTGGLYEKLALMLNALIFLNIEIIIIIIPLLPRSSSPSSSL